MDPTNGIGKYKEEKDGFTNIGGEIIIESEEDPQRKNDIVVMGNYSKEEIEEWLDNTVQTAESAVNAKSIEEVRSIIFNGEGDPETKSGIVVMGNYSKEELKDWLDSNVKNAESEYIAKSLEEIGGIGISIDGEGDPQKKGDIVVMGDYSKDSLKEWLNSTVQTARSAWSARSIEEVNYIVRDYEIETMSKFIAQSSNKNFGNGDIYAEKHKVRWADDSINYDGVPFSIIGSKRLDCHHGKDRKYLNKESIKQKKNKIKMSDPNYRKRKVMLQDSKKCGCTADVKVTEIIRFPSCRIDSNTKYHRRTAASLIKKGLEEKSIDYEREFVLILPPTSHHTKHVTKHVTGEAADTCQTIFPRLIKEINKNAGIIKSVDEMKRQLELVVKQELFPAGQCPQKSNKRFFPKLKTIRTHMVDALRKLCNSKIDQESLDKKIEEWKCKNQDDNFYFRPKGKVNNKNIRKDENYEESHDDVNQDAIRMISAPGDSLLFVYQAAWQKRLLKKYGNELCLLDATYKTTGYALPLFFLVVKTNVDYQVVGSFITEGESSGNVIDGLEILKDWNPDLNPMFAMVDLSVEEINAIETLYPGCDIYISDFHREHAWEKWLSAHINGCFMIKDEMLYKLRDIAWALSEDDLEIAINNFQNCDEWKNPAYSNMVTWFNEQWMPVLTRWVWFYRQERLLMTVNSNNGVEQQNEMFKYEYLKKHHGTSLTGMLTILIEEYFPDSYESYCDANTKCSSNYRRYNTNIPSFLHNRPQSLVEHCLSEINTAADIDMNGVHQKGIGRFVVLSQNTECVVERYELHFGDENIFPKCTCMEWKRMAFPCKHFFAVFWKFPAWDWNSLSVLYIESPFMTLDREVNPILDQGNVDKRNICNELLIPYNQNEVEIATSLSDNLPYGKTSKSNKTSLCKDISSSITNDISLVRDNNVIEEVYRNLLVIKQIIDRTVLKESNNSLTEKPKKRRSNFTPLAVPLKKKPLEEKLDTSLTDGNDNADNILTSNSSVVETEVVQINDPFSHPFQPNLHDLVALIESEAINFIILPNDEISLIKNGYMLTDISINAAQNILKKQFETPGFQDTLLNQTMDFKEMKTPFLQILHNDTFHWIAITSIDCPSNTLYYYDSMFHGKIKNNILQQICTIYKSEGNSLTVKVCSCQQQGNSVDGGIYAVAFCYYILKGVDISKLHLKESSLREHFLKCILDGHFSDFPLNNKATCMSNEKNIDFDLFCRCKLPWLWFHNKHKDMYMAQCESCNEWYHRKCENIPDYVFSYKDRKWSCKDCYSKL